MNRVFHPMEAARIAANLLYTVSGPLAIEELGILFDEATNVVLAMTPEASRDLFLDYLAGLDTSCPTW